MQDLNWYIRRFRSMERAEIAWRVRSLLRDQVDLARIPLGFVPKLSADCRPGLDNFKPGFSCTPISTDSWSEPLSPMMQQWLDRLIHKADNALENRLTYFDLENFDHGNPFDWHRDHSAGIQSPIRLSVLTNYRNFATYGDCKLVWEPNRHHQFVVLARAYVATGDRKYATKVAELLRSWLESNPFGYGMNWKSVLEHGIRVINWVWALDLIRDSGAIDKALWSDVQQSVYLAMWDAQRKFSRGSSANNHLIGEAAGVFIGACYFRHFPHADRWARKAQDVLEQEILRQTYADGCAREHAFGYQFFVIQFFQLCMQAGDAGGFPFSESYKDRLRSMFRFMTEISRDTGEPPNMGDRDDGYVLDLGELPNQASDLLSVGGYLFEDPTLVTSNAAESVFWITGINGQKASAGTAAPESRPFPESGYFFLRSARIGVFFDVAALGYGPIAAHGHADCLSFCLSVDGHPVIVDAGTYDYFSHPQWRNYFRETRAHNTIEIDGISQSEMQGPFMWGHRARASITGWQDDDSNTLVSGEHDGYENLSDPVTHRRELNLDKVTNTLTINDRLDCDKNHVAILHFHLAAACEVRQEDKESVVISGSWGTLRLSSQGAAIECITPNDHPAPGWVSNGYHRKQRSTALTIRLDVQGSASHRCQFRLLEKTSEQTESH